MQKIRNFTTFSTLLFLLIACGSDDKQPPILDTWETNQGRSTLYVTFYDDSATTLFLSDNFDCYIQLQEPITYIEPNIIQTEDNIEVEYNISGNVLTINSNETFTKSNVNLDNLNYCEDPSIEGDILITTEFDDFSEQLRTQEANLNLDYSYSVHVYLDMDKDDAQSVGDLEFIINFDSDSDNKKNPSLSQFNKKIAVITEIDQGTTSFETIAYPTLTFDKSANTVSLSIKRGSFLNFLDISLSSNIGVKAATFFSTSNDILSDTFPNAGYMNIGNLSSSEDAIDDLSGTGENINLMDIKSISITITE